MYLYLNYFSSKNIYSVLSLSRINKKLIYIHFMFCPFFFNSEHLAHVHFIKIVPKKLSPQILTIFSCVVKKMYINKFRKLHVKTISFSFLIYPFVSWKKKTVRKFQNNFHLNILV